jgi:hypothetical protein
MKPEDKLKSTTVQMYDAAGSICDNFPIKGKYKSGTKITTKTTDKLGGAAFITSINHTYEIYTPTPSGTFEHAATINPHSKHAAAIRLKFIRSEFLAITEIRVEDLNGNPVAHSHFSIFSEGKTKAAITGSDGKAAIHTKIGQSAKIQLQYPDKTDVSGADYTFTAKRHDNGKFRLIVPIKQTTTQTATEKPFTPLPPITSPCAKPDCESLFKKVAPIILRHEGGWVNDPNDSGGATNMGITIATFKSYAQEDLGIEPTIENLRKLTQEQATKIYRKRYWEPRGYCELQSLKVALMIYDWSITSGGALAEVNKLLQDHYRVSPQKKMDAQAINSIADQQDLLERIGEIRKKYYTNLAIKNGQKTKNFKFLRGWLNRVNDCISLQIK